MKQRINRILLTLSVVLMGSFIATPAFASASFKSDACEGVNTLNNTAGDNCDPDAGKKVNEFIKAIIQILSFIVGIAAVIMVIVGGLKYITANGDSGALASARSTITYALIGLVIVALAQVLVHFVLNKIAT